MDDFGRYLYLPRLRDSTVLLEAIRDGFALTSWDLGSFAYADSLDESNGRYRGLKCRSSANCGRERARTPRAA